MNRDLFERGTFLDSKGQRWAKKGGDTAIFVEVLRAIRKEISSAEKYLKTRGEEFPWADTWLQHGKVYKPPTKLICQSMAQAGGFKERGHCYKNSLFLCLDLLGSPLESLHSVSYVEGLAVLPTGAFWHAWVTFGNGVALDNTWNNAYMATYFGISFQPKRAYQTMKRNAKFGFVGEETWKHSQQKIKEYLSSLVLA